jgi:hypothetical protein
MDILTRHLFPRPNNVSPCPQSSTAGIQAPTYPFFGLVNPMNIESDAFTFRVTVKNRLITRRAILSTVSSIYDSLGFLVLFVLKAKQILQELCKLKCGWDQVIPEEHSISWKRWLSELDQLYGV